MSVTITGLGAFIIILAVGIDVCYNIYRLINWIVTKSNDIKNDPLYKCNMEYINKIRYYIDHEKDIREVVQFSCFALQNIQEKKAIQLDDSKRHSINESLFNLSQIILIPNKETY